MITRDEEDKIEINKEDITKILDVNKMNYEYKQIILSNPKEITDFFLEIIDYSSYHGIDDEISEEKVESIKENSDSDKDLNNSLMAYKNLFDIILSFNTIQSLKKGWDLKFSDKGLKYFDKIIKCPKIGILGNKRVGKSFILSKLFGIPEIKSPNLINDQIMIKLKERKNKINYIIFDTQGFNFPILEEKNEEEEDESEDIDEFISTIKDEKFKKESEINMNNKNDENDIKMDNISKTCNITSNCVNTKEFKKRKNLKEMEINRKLSEDFITRFVLNYSDMIINRNFKTFSQIMLNKIMEECIKYKKDNLYVIHNLKEFEEKEQVIDYIQNILMKSGTFDLEKKMR